MARNSLKELSIVTNTFFLKQVYHWIKQQFNCTVCICLNIQWSVGKLLPQHTDIKCNKMHHSEILQVHFQFFESIVPKSCNSLIYIIDWHGVLYVQRIKRLGVALYFEWPSIIGWRSIFFGRGFIKLFIIDLIERTKTSTNYSLFSRKKFATS